MVKADDDVEGMGLSNPLGVEAFGAVPLVLQPLCVALLGLVATPVAIVALFLRTRAARGTERSQLQWLLLGFVLCLGLSVVVDLAVGFAAIPVCIAVAVVRHGLFDVDLVVNRTLVYGLLTLASLLAYAGVVALAGQYIPGENRLAPFVAAVVVAAAAAARSRVQRLVDQLLFGARRDPMAVVASVGASVDAAPDPLHALAEAVTGALRLPFVQVLDADGSSVAEHGAPVAGTHVLPVVNRGRKLGVLIVGRRSRGERLRTEEEAALREVARRAGSLMREAALVEDLRAGYEQIVSTREEERKRLRHDLHDGVGPSLAGLALQVDSLAARLRDDPGLHGRAERLRDDLRRAVAEVRGIVDGLRPAALDEIGVAGALEALASRDTDPIVSVECDSLPQLPAAVEVTAYRIACEAVTNAVRHAGAGQVRLELSAVPGELVVTVEDDGHGFGADHVAGLGLRSMHERAESVGGHVEVASGPTGTTVRARLPCSGSAGVEEQPATPATTGAQVSP
jgi:signal transduction histidine kinase